MEWFNKLLYTSWLSDSGLWLWFGMAVVVLVITLVVLTALVLRRIWFVAFWLFFLLPGILIFAIWPDLWVWLIPSWVFALIALIVGTAHRRGQQPHRGWGVFLTVIATVLALLGGMFGLGLVPTPGAPQKCVVSQESSTPGVHLYFFDEGKQTGGSFGTPVVNTAGDQATFDELHERRACDPYLAAAHAEDYGLIPAGSKNQFAARFNASASLWGQYNAQMEKMDNERRSATIIDTPAGSASWYMAARPDGTIWIHDGFTAFDGHSLVITFADGSTVTLRLECGFQPIFDTPPGNPSCPPSWGPECLEPKDAGLAPAVINDGGPIHQVNTGTESTVLDEHPQETADQAKEDADKINQADEEKHDDAVDDATTVDETVDGHVDAPPE